MQTFLRTQHEHVSAFMSVCTGYLGPLHAGLLRNTRATAPRGLLHSLKGFPDVQWEERRWVRDGKMWSSGAVMNGFEMMGEFMRERWGGEEGGLVDVVLKAADVMKRGREY
jgi:transcriptional regulator GlxA family with amidase domain